MRASKTNQKASILLLTLAACCARVFAAGWAGKTLEELRQIVYSEASTRLVDLGQITDGDGNLERLYMSPAHKQAAHQIQAWMDGIGLHTSLDGVANVRGRLQGKYPEQPAWLMGSHYDTVVDGGFFDGALGVIAAIAAVKALLLEAAMQTGVISPIDARSVAHGQKQLQEAVKAPLDSLLPAPVEIIAFSEEEGLRFQSTFLASQAVTGSLATSGLLDAKDAGGLSLMELLRQEGLAQTPADLSKSSINPEHIAGYVEVHMEQGPVLEAMGKPLGVVTGIAGQSRLSVSMQGIQGHAGTVPMGLRRDPLAGAAEAIQQIEQICNGGPEAAGQTPRGPFAKDTSLVCTVGSMTIWPGSSNVIPGVVNFTIDIRSQDDEVRRNVISTVRQNIDSRCSRRQLQCSVERRNEVQAVPCNADIVEQLAAAAANVQGISSSSAAAGKGMATSPVPRLVSGAGHDAMAMASITKMGMMFVRCAGGISHSSLENVTKEDISTAVAALHDFLRSAVGRIDLTAHQEL
ncbi:hypothetical protein WJX74_002133 [Apatococcus lobatus]|uniref:Peptidase M20 dimerisation domain-containing protein n=1 Tax=Apatococcus lobatus TaxID=904363 RepID=A0AAW1S213_9CHLO